MVLDTPPHTPSLVARARERGFTLAEMLVSIGIMTIVSSLMLANNARFGGQVLLQNLAYDIALSVRQAQVYGISVQRFGSTNTFADGYGMVFQTSANTSYSLFGDLNSNRLYDVGGGELLQASSIRSGYRINGLYVTPVNGVEVPVTRIDVTYRRPEPDAYITRNADGSTLYEQARIELISPRGDTKSVVLSVNGQITVQ